MSTRAVVLSWSLVGVFIIVLAVGYIMRWSWTGLGRIVSFGTCST